MPRLPDTCAEKVPLVSMGAERRVKRTQTRERGPPSAPAEFEHIFSSLGLELADMETNERLVV